MDNGLDIRYLKYVLLLPLATLTFILGHPRCRAWPHSSSAKHSHSNSPSQTQSSHRNLSPRLHPILRQHNLRYDLPELVAEQTHQRLRWQDTGFQCGHSYTTRRDVDSDVGSAGVFAVGAGGV